MFSLHKGKEDPMAEEDTLSGDAREPTFHLELTAAQLKVTHTALKVFFDDLGHEVRSSSRCSTSCPASTTSARTT